MGRCVRGRRTPYRALADASIRLGRVNARRSGHRSSRAVPGGTPWWSTLALVSPAAEPSSRVDHDLADFFGSSWRRVAHAPWADQAAAPSNRWSTAMVSAITEPSSSLTWRGLYGCAARVRPRRWWWPARRSPPTTPASRHATPDFGLSSRLLSNRCLPSPSRSAPIKCAPLTRHPPATSLLPERSPPSRAVVHRPTFRPSWPTRPARSPPERRLRYDQAIALQNWFRGFTYDLSFRAGQGQSAMQDFLAQRRGYCEQIRRHLRRLRPRARPAVAGRGRVLPGRTAR